MKINSINYMPLRANAQNRKAVNNQSFGANTQKITYETVQAFKITVDKILQKPLTKETVQELNKTISSELGSIFEVDAIKDKKAQRLLFAIFKDIYEKGFAGPGTNTGGALTAKNLFLNGETYRGKEYFDILIDTVKETMEKVKNSSISSSAIPKEDILAAYRDLLNTTNNILKSNKYFPYYDVPKDKMSKVGNWIEIIDKLLYPPAQFHPGIRIGLA